jgi:pSer/pThr/pTyr-binding forkhead associated (FHA) protein
VATGDETQVVAGHAWLEVGGRRHPLSSRVTCLGRGTDVDLRIDDPGVSRRHAEIRHGANTVIVDLGSTNGTVVDGRVAKQAPLDDGSRIVIGNTTLIYRRARS